MPADSPNRQWWTYVDDHGTSWNKMGQIDAGCNAIDGSAAAVGGQPDFPRKSRRYQARAARFIDATTYRTKTCVMYTAAASAALTGTSTVAVHVPGETATVSYTFDGLIPEKTPTKAVSRNLTDHA